MLHIGELLKAIYIFKTHMQSSYLCKIVFVSNFSFPRLPWCFLAFFNNYNILPFLPEKWKMAT